MEKVDSSIIKERFIQVGYVMGLSLILAAIIYFFAANWPGFDKWTKISLSIALMVLFYGTSYLFTTWLKRRPFLSEWLMFTGCLTFGVTVAILGQIYNSHADSFQLFLVWAIPALLFSIFTKYQPFYILSHVLLHVALWFWMFPSSSFFGADEGWYRSLLIIVAVVNVSLFLIIQKGWLQSKALSFLSLAAFHGAMLGLTLGELFEPFIVFVSVIYIAAAAFLFWYSNRQGWSKWFTVISGLAATFFLIWKFIAFLLYIGSESIFYLTIYFPFIIVGIAVVLIRKFKENTMAKRVFIGVIAIVSAFIGASSFIGIVMLIVGEMEPIMFALFATAFLIVPAVLKPQWDSVIRYTMLLTGYFITIPSVLFEGMWISLLFLLVLGFVFLKVTSQIFKYITYLAGMIVFVAAFSVENISPETVSMAVIALNLVILFGRTYLLKNLQHILYHNSVIYSLLAFFVWTFLNEQSYALYFVVNVLYFVTVTVLLFVAIRKEATFLFIVSFVGWLAYVGYKYYDLLWSLLHKSITFMLVGVLIFAIVNWVDKRTAFNSEVRSFVAIRKGILLVIISIQLVIIGVQVTKSERVLANGETVTLQLEPLDPRSLLQGDYVILRFTISRLELKEEPSYNEKIKVGLVQNKQGVYEYHTHVVGDEKESGAADVWITGRYKGNGNVEYGIENYFIEEGTGREVEENARYAKIKVGKNGDALLIEVYE
ncbi:GDYXXLXY domain-containing protein [Metabacillus iocasae]|uniref:Membrane-anchored protein/putative membrane protein n=1 Tax=Priestia iocasae TaxID=2291674 RepID=A0ABS2QRJ5_9BACI|nr:GDYXXLXY domain-containing protein [Metabacillus iocasae]MBM7702066.1 putative membrane-anchored protein/putative membrane protein [Metabacillus iocasae]